MDTSSAKEIYNFDEPFLPVYKIKFIKRKSPTSPFEVQHFKLMSVIAACMFIYMFCFLMRIIQVFRGYHMELAQIGELAAVASAYVMCFSRGATLLLHKIEVQRLLQNLEKLFPVTKQDQLKYELQSYAKRILRRNNIMRTLCLFGNFVFLTKPICISLFYYFVRGQRYVYRYPFISWHPFDDNRLISYPFVYIFQIATSMGVVFFLLNEDLLFTTSVTQMCMHYRYLSNLLSELDAKLEKRSRQKLKVLIQYQYFLEDLRYDVDDIFSVSTFISFTIMKATICMFLFSLFNGADIITAMLFLVSISAIIIPVYLRCSNGTELHEASSSLIDSMYDHNWYEGTPKHRRMIVIMMTRANRPVLLHASQMKLISMEYFKECLVQIYQIFMFLYNFSK